MLWNDKIFNERKRKLVCKVFAGFMGFMLLLSAIIVTIDISMQGDEVLSNTNISYTTDNKCYTIEEFTSNISLLNKPVKIVDNGCEYRVEQINCLGYVIEDTIKLGQTEATDSFGHIFNIVGKLTSDENVDYYIVELSETTYSYIETQYITIDQNEFSSIQTKREEQELLEQINNKDNENVIDLTNESYKYSIYEENGVIYATANDIVHISKYDTASKQKYNLDGKVCVTGKIKAMSTASDCILETIQGNFRTYYLWSTVDKIYLDNDAMESSIGITVEIESNINQENFEEVTMYIAKAEESTTAETDLYLYNDVYYWIEEQNLTAETKIRVYGEGSWGVFDTYDIDCTKVEILNNKDEVISTFEYKE